MLTLFAAPRTCSLATCIALEEAGAEYELVRLDFAAGQQHTPEYLAKNPKGRVPALATPQGLITENVALLSYVAQSFPAARLAPTDPFHFAQMQAFNAYLASTVHVNHAHNRRGHRWSDDPDVVEKLKIKVPQNMRDCYALIEKHMLKGPWVMGEDYSVADGYLYTIDTWLKGDGVDIAEFPRLHEHFHRMEERPALRRAVAKHE